MSEYDDYDDYIESLEENHQRDAAAEHERLKQKLGASVTIEVDPACLVQGLLDRIMREQTWHDDLVDIVKATVKKEAIPEVTRLSSEVVEEEVRKVVQGVIADGFQEVTSWGEPRGEKKTFKQVVYEVMTAEDKDSYGKKSGTLIARTIRAAVKVAVSELVGEHMADLKSKVERDLNESWADAVIHMIRTKYNI